MLGNHINVNIFTKTNSSWQGWRFHPNLPGPMSYCSDPICLCVRLSCKSGLSPSQSPQLTAGGELPDLRDMLHQGYMGTPSKVCGKIFLLLLKKVNYQIWSQFHTATVLQVTWVNLWPDWIIRIKTNFTTFCFKYELISSMWNESAHQTHSNHQDRSKYCTLPYCHTYHQLHLY